MSILVETEAREHRPDDEDSNAKLTEKIANARRRPPDDPIHQVRARQAEQQRERAEVWRMASSSHILNLNERTLAAIRTSGPVVYAAPERTSVVPVIPDAFAQLVARTKK